MNRDRTNKNEMNEESTSANGQEKNSGVKDKISSALGNGKSPLKNPNGSGGNNNVGVNQSRSLWSTLLWFLVLFYLSEIFIMRPLKRKVENQQRLAQVEAEQRILREAEVRAMEEEEANILVENMAKNKNTETETGTKLNVPQEVILENANVKLVVDTYGLKFENLLLKNYVDSAGKNIELLGGEDTFAMNWLATDKNIRLPNRRTLWKLEDADARTLKSVRVKNMDEYVNKYVDGNGENVENTGKNEENRGNGEGNIGEESAGGNGQSYKRENGARENGAAADAAIAVTLPEIAEGVNAPLERAGNSEIIRMDDRIGIDGIDIDEDDQNKNNNKNANSTLGNDRGEGDEDIGGDRTEKEMQKLAAGKGKEKEKQEKLGGQEELKESAWEPIWVTFVWDNGGGLRFRVRIELDENYMLKLQHIVENSSGDRLQLRPVWQLEKKLKISKSEMTSFSGALGVFNGGGMMELKSKKIKNASVEYENFDWAGITTKYWLTALVNGNVTNGRVNFFETDGITRMQYSTREDLSVDEKSPIILENRLFMGVKDMKVLKHYAKNENVKFLDRSIDFGFFYFLARPLDRVLNFFSTLTKNFGIAIILLTILIKMLLYPLVKKSFRSMEVMKRVQPKLTELQVRFKDDPLRLRQEVLKIYSQYDLNPLASMLPLFVQIPVFIALYRVISVSLNMRQAPFFGFIKDLSLADPSNIFNLFGLLHFNPKLKLGLLPCLMGLSMFLQQYLTEKSTRLTDGGHASETAAKNNAAGRNSTSSSDINSAMKNNAKTGYFMPILFMLAFASFPSGLLLYWIFNNVISILQQQYIAHRFRKEQTGNAVVRGVKRK